jgi:arsenite-transporting ATPase
MVLVTLPEPTPVHEAMRLRDDLKRAGIVPFGWVVNRSLALTGVTEPILAGKAAKEIEPLREIMALGEPFTILPWVAQPVGALQSAGRE